MLGDSVVNPLLIELSLDQFMMLRRLWLILPLAVSVQSRVSDVDWKQIQANWASPPSSGRAHGAWADPYYQEPPVSPEYMVDNTNNNHGVAPIKGKYNGPVWEHSGSFQNYMEELHEKKASGLLNSSATTNSSGLHRKRASNYWLPQLAGKGKAPHAGNGYVFYRNVLDYGADNTGGTDTVEAINAAIQDGDRCGLECGNTFVKGALIYFPPGTYKICTPIVQFYYTQFVSDPGDRAIIKGCDKFKGIALIDVDPYVPNQAQPDGSGVNWYINQNQFFRQIRNFVFDMRDMPSATDEHGQKLVPTGLHWQVSQATSLQNLLFKMPTTAKTGVNVTHVGIFTENGSGGFVSDLEFEGGAIGWRVGSQQYTAIGLKFTNCLTAVQMIWDWGFNWQRIEVNGGTVAFNISGKGGVDKQGIGSISLIDSAISGTPIGILTNADDKTAPNIVIDNTQFTSVGAIVQDTTGKVLLAGGSTKVDLWATGLRYSGGDGTRQTGAVEKRPSISSQMLDGGKLFTRSRPQYEKLGVGDFLVATDHGCSNDGTGDNTNAINAFLKQAASAGKVAYFPAGIYTIKGTVTVPAGSKLQGTSWSQIQATGEYFNDMDNPKVAVRVGEAGNVGTMEIVEMLFTVNGPTAGAIMVEWNIKALSPGAAGLWDSHIRIGGGIGTGLDQATCPKLSYNPKCIAAAMLLHITPGASGYFENMWAWTADHDNDYSLYWEVDMLVSQISVYTARGVLIESQDPVWIYGSGSEHTIMYQYQTYKAKNVYLGHIQTETPYFQPKPVAPQPFNTSKAAFKGDPDFSDCKDDACKEAWGLRVLFSEGITVHSAGLYSWFSNYAQQPCLKNENCQSRVMEVRGSKAVAMYNIFTKGVVELATGQGYNISSKAAQQGFTTEISVWFPRDDNADAGVVPVPSFEGERALDPVISHCNDEQKKKVRTAWIEAGTLAKLHWQWSPGGKWQNAMDLYMGNHSRKDYDFWGDPGPLVGQNIGRQWSIHFAGIWQHPLHSYALFYCGDSMFEEKRCGKGNNPIAYTWDNFDGGKNIHSVVFCDLFFDSKDAPSLSEMVERADGNINMQLDIDKWYDVTASSLLHETYHWEYTVSEPRAGDITYPAKGVADLAWLSNTEESRLNAESYADAAISIFIMDTWGHANPPTPGGEPYDPTAATRNTASPSTLDHIDSPPAGWVSPFTFDTVNDIAYIPESPDLAIMSTLGNTQDDSQSNNCLQGSSFWTKIQCDTFCKFGTCDKTTEAGNTWYKCSSCPRPNTCINGDDYLSIPECEQLCNSAKGGTCSRKKKGFRHVSCSGCTTTPVCTPGKYPDFDTCGDNCRQGQCQENAGQAGVVCTCP